MPEYVDALRIAAKAHGSNFRQNGIKKMWIPDHVRNDDPLKTVA